jgi:uncharacterized protein (TIGR01732 family)
MGIHITNSEKPCPNQNLYLYIIYKEFIKKGGGTRMGGAVGVGGFGGGFALLIVLFILLIIIGASFCGGFY